MIGRRNNIVMVRLPTPKRVRIPNGRTFLAKYERRERIDLSANVAIKIKYKKEL